MSQELRRTGVRRGSVWRAITALTGVAAMLGAMIALAPAASATGGGNNDYKGGDVTICHANNGHWGYTENTVSVNSVLRNSGHDSHSGDIIPPFDYQKWVKTGRHSGEWQDASYPGKNWDAAGQEIWGNDCNVPDTTVTVNKVWKINGQEAAEWPDGYDAQLQIATKKHKGWNNAVNRDWATSYTYNNVTKIKISEKNVVVPEGCTLTDSYGTGEKSISSGSNVFTVTNKVTCVEDTTVTVNKVWKINGDTVTEWPDGYQAQLRIATKKHGDWNYSNRDWATSYTYNNVTKIKISEKNVVVPEGCTLTDSDGTGEKNISSGPNVFTVTNKVTCTPPKEQGTVNLYKIWEGATGEPSTTLTISSGDSTDSATSTWDSSLGSDPDWYNDAYLSGFAGDSVTIAETAVTGYDASWACYESFPALRSPAGAALISAVPDSYGTPVSSGSGTSATFDMPAGYMSCFFTNTKQSTPPPPPPPPSVLPTSVTPAFTAECTLDGEESLVTVTTTSVDGIVYEVTGNGTSAVTVVASAPSPSFTLVVPAGWTAGTGDSASIVVTDAGLTCVGGEQEEVDEEETTPEPEAQPEPEVAGASEEVVTGAPSAAAKTGESSSDSWAYLVLAAGMLLLFGSARIRRSHGA